MACRWRQRITSFKPAALTHPRAPQLRKDFDLDQFQHMESTREGFSTARDVLLSEKNRRLRLYDNPNNFHEPWTCEDMVQQNWEILEEIRSHQTKLRSSDTKQWEIRKPFSRRLEGFGFVDIISNQSGLEPRFAELKGSGANWLKATTQSGAINILGSSFGELVVPLPGECKMIRSVPQGLDLLVMPIKRLELIAEKYGEINNDSIKLINGVFLNDPQSSLGSKPCGCTISSAPGYCGKRVTELQCQRKKVHKARRKLETDVLVEYPAGAVIIGLHNALKSGNQRDRTDERGLSMPGAQVNGADSGIDVGSVSSNETRTS